MPRAQRAEARRPERRAPVFVPWVLFLSEGRRRVRLSLFGQEPSFGRQQFPVCPPGSRASPPEHVRPLWLSPPPPSRLRSTSPLPIHVPPAHSGKCLAVPIDGIVPGHKPALRILRRRRARPFHLSPGTRRRPLAPSLTLSQPCALGPRQPGRAWPCSSLASAYAGREGDPQVRIGSGGP